MLVILQFSQCTVLFGILPSSLLPKIDDRSFDLKFCPGHSFSHLVRGQLFIYNFVRVIHSVPIFLSSLPIFGVVPQSFFQNRNPVQDEDQDQDDDFTSDFNSRPTFHT